MKNDMSFIYVGKGVKNGSIDADSLICGLGGLIKLSEVMLDVYEPRRKNTSLRIENFDKGSFKTILKFIKKNPELIGLIGSTSVIFAAIISSLAWQTVNEQQIVARENELKIIIAARENESEAVIKASENELKIIIKARENELETVLAWYVENNKQTEKIEIEDIKKVLSLILSDPSLKLKIKEGFRGMASPLNEYGIDTVQFGLVESPKEIINQENKYYFLVGDTPKEEIQKPIKLVGKFRSLDKITLNGRFITNDENTYSIFLAMASPESYFNYFDKENITISGIATYEKESKKITKIEIKQIR